MNRQMPSREMVGTVQVNTRDQPGRGKSLMEGFPARTGLNLEARVAVVRMRLLTRGWYSGIPGSGNV